MGEISAPAKNERERKERKKGGDEGLNGFELSFPLATSFHSFPKFYNKKNCGRFGQYFHFSTISFFRGYNL